MDGSHLKFSPFHGENRGSIPLGRASDFNRLAPDNPQSKLLFKIYTEKCCGLSTRASLRCGASPTSAYKNGTVDGGVIVMTRLEGCVCDRDNSQSAPYFAPCA